MGEWVIGTSIGDLRDYHRDPFPHSLLRTRQIRAVSASSWREVWLEGAGSLGLAGPALLRAGFLVTSTILWGS